MDKCAIGEMDIKYSISPSMRHKIVLLVAMFCVCCWFLFTQFLFDKALGSIMLSEDRQSGCTVSLFVRLLARMFFIFLFF